jgi:hypothetical protein
MERHARSPTTRSIPFVFLKRYFLLPDQSWQTKRDTLLLLKCLRTGVRLGHILRFAAGRNTTWRCALPKEDHLKSKYLAFFCNFCCGPNGDVDIYLRGTWDAIGSRIREI